MDSALRAADAVRAGVAATEDSVPEPDCLAELLRAEEHPAAMLGRSLDLGDPRFVTDAGLSATPAGAGGPAASVRTGPRGDRCSRGDRRSRSRRRAPCAPASSELGGFDGTTDAEVDLGGG